MCVCIYIHPVTLWVEEHLQRMHFNRRRQIAYQKLPIGLRIPLSIHHCLHSPCQPLCAMTASQILQFFDFSRNRDFLSPRSNSESLSETTWSAEIKRNLFLLYLHSVTTRGFWPALFHHEIICQWSRKACHEYKMQVCTLQRHTRTGIKTHRPTTSHVRRLNWNHTLSLLCASVLVSYASDKQKRRKTRRTMPSALIPRGRVLH